MGRLDYDERLHAVYSQGRALSPAVQSLWVEAFRPYLKPGDELLDLGSGTGNWSHLLAQELGVRATGVEPSERMRAVAEAEHPKIRLLEGAAELIPLPDESFDAALLSYVIHHFEDRGAAVAELARVLRPGGHVLIRQTMREALPLVPWLRFFPSAMAIAERQMPSREEVIKDFTAGDFELVASEPLLQEMAPSLSAFAERVSWRAISTLELIPDAEFEQGLEAMRAEAAKETDAQPVEEEVDLLVFRR